MKACCKCKVEKPFIEFHKNKNMKDGLNYACKDCNYQYRVELRAKKGLPAFKKDRRNESLGTEKQV